MRGLLSRWRAVDAAASLRPRPWILAADRWHAGRMAATHEVTNQPPPLVGYDASEDPAMLSALHREGAGWAEDEVRRLGRLAGGEQAQENGRLANENPPRLRTHDRYGHRIDEVEFHPAWHELMRVAVTSGLHARAVAGRPARRARRPGGGLLRVGPDGRRARLPDIDDLLDRAGPAARPRAGPPVRAAAGRAGLRPRPAPAAGEGRPAVGHVDDREAGRLRCPRQHHHGHPGRRWHLPDHRPQVVYLGADERPVHGPRPGAGRIFSGPRPVLLPAAPRAARRHAQRDAVDAAEGQARQPIQRLGRG